MAITPKTREKVHVPKAQISYMAKNSKYSYEQLVVMIQQILELVLNTTKAELEIYIDNIVPKRTGQLRAMLKQWLNGSNIYKGVMRLVMGTNLKYAEDVNKMTTSQVRHNKEVGYVYYPNIYGIRGRVILDDPRAQGSFWDKMLEFAKERVDINLIKAKNKILGKTVRAKAHYGGFEVTA